MLFCPVFFICNKTILKKPRNSSNIRAIYKIVYQREMHDKFHCTNLRSAMRSLIFWQKRGKNLSTAALGFAFQKIVLLKWVTISKNLKGMILNFVQVIRIREYPGLRHSMLLYLEAIYTKREDTQQLSSKIISKCTMFIYRVLQF